MKRTFPTARFFEHLTNQRGGARGCAGNVHGLSGNPLCRYEVAGPGIPSKNRTKTEKTWKIESGCVCRACEGAVVPGAVLYRMQSLLFVFGFVPVPTRDAHDHRDAATA